MKFKDGYFNRVTIIVLALLLLISIIFTLSFWLEEWFNFGNPITNTLQNIYWRVYPVWISVIVSFMNILCAVTRIQCTYEKRKENKKAFAGCIAYAVFSFAIFTVSFITSDYVLGSVIASV